MRAEAALPRLYVPEEVAAVLGCSAWWVKDRARRRLIPFTRVGRAYRFTGEHLAEIIRLHEARPALPQKQAATPPAPKPPAPQPPSQSAAAKAHLRARPPRRARQSQFGTAA
ncbi:MULTISPECIES: helix-turn-helix domain-containing protein [unclassified Streptomyces]|uniref:Helix-turn-helix domain-containing protein n=1 Tax=Streptomyces doudnae TaxID=3075536 RepID=A0ABD5F205_9ACTN|nr:MULTISPECIES: helix-turn-helix domain-containing protein [unclassified Streptomyces]MDT0439717.1 helix-turn-helix domain-containing protein [Streptomyces sp. DSM 41981]